MDQGYIETFIQDKIKLIIDTTVRISYFVCISHNIIFGAYIGTLAGLTPFLFPIVSTAATFLPILIPQAATVLPYVTLVFSLLPGILEPGKGFEIPFLNTLIKDIEDDLDSTSWLYLESCASKLLVSGEKTCFDPNSVDDEDVLEVIDDYIESAITNIATFLGFDPTTFDSEDIGGEILQLFDEPYSSLMNLLSGQVSSEEIIFPFVSHP